MKMLGPLPKRSPVHRFGGLCKTPHLNLILVACIERQRRMQFSISLHIHLSNRHVPTCKAERNMEI